MKESGSMIKHTASGSTSTTTALLTKANGLKIASPVKVKKSGPMALSLQASILMVSCHILNF